MSGVPINRRILNYGARNRPSTRHNSGIYGHVNRNLWICWHETDNYSKTAGAANHAAWLFNNPEMLVGWQYTVDHKSIYKHIPINEGAWHAGDGVNGSGNLHSIGIEVCVNKVNYDYSLYLKAVDNAAWLSAKLIRENRGGSLVFPDGLRQHFHFSGKNCPRIIRSEGKWNHVISRVEYHLYGEEEEEVPATGYRVAVFSYKTYEEAENALEKTQRAFPAHEPFIVLNEVNGELWFRVILVEHERRDHAETARDTAKARLGQGWIVSTWKDLPFEKPEPEPPEYEDPDYDEDFTPVLSPQTATKKQAKEWARKNNAHQRFVDIAPMYFKYGAKTGINPVLLYAQAALETGFGRYTGAVPPEYNNWAGIKTADATGDEPEDHEQFSSPEEGVRAHFNHVCAYIGKDPIGVPHGRYYVVKRLSWAGTIRYMEEFSGKWAPSMDYGERVIALARGIESTEEPPYDEEPAPPDPPDYEDPPDPPDEEEDDNPFIQLIISVLTSLISFLENLKNQLGGR